MKNKIIFKTLMLKGEAGSTIVSMVKTGHVGTADIYTITFNDGSTTEISLENMSAITSVEKTSSTDTEDIYTITCADGSTQTFSVLNHNADIVELSEELEAGLESMASGLADQSALLNARMDTFTSLPQGSTSGDAELIDLRVGANGVTYESAGSAVRGQINDIQNEIGSAPKKELLSITPDNIYNIIDSTQINRLVNGKTYEIQVIIDSNVTNGTISLSTTSSSSGQYKFFKNNEPIAAGTYKFYFVYDETVGHSIYLRLYLDTTYTYCSNAKLFLIDTTTIRSLINQNSVEINTINGNFEKKLTEFTPASAYSVIDSPDLKRFKDGKKYAIYVVINSDVTSGTISLSATTSASGTVYTFESDNPIKAGTHIYEFTYDETWTTAGLYLRLYLDGDYSKCSKVTIYNVVAEDLRSFVALLGENLEIIEEDPKKYKYAMDSIICIGDSLTDGIYDNGQYSPVKQNYPYYLGRMLNTDVENAGFNGLSAKDWWDNKANLYTYTDYNTVVIWLGTNGGLTDTLDTDVNPYNNYEDYADTNTGDYCKIIEKIKTENPHCMIILCNCFAGTYKATTNSVIEKIADKYGLIVVDMSDMGTNNHPEWHNSTIPVHLGKAGNIIAAKRVVDTASAYFEDDPLRCEYGLNAKA